MQIHSAIRTFFVALTLSAAVAGAGGAQAAKLTAHQQLARDVYQQLIAINSADSVGAVTPAAEAMAKRFRDAGFPAADVQLLIPAGKPKKGNLVVRYRGRGAPGSAKPILLLAHLDVVAALRSDWPRDPFTLVEQNGYFYGRGTSDDKSMAAMFVANLLTYKKEGWRPDRDIILALTADEESGDANGAEWLSKEHRNLIDAAYAFNEGGGGTLDGPGMDAKPLFHTVQAAEKVYYDFTLTTHNTGGHSSVPRPDNAIYELADGLARLEHFQFPVALNPTTREFLTQSAKVEKPEIAAAMRAIVANEKDSVAGEFLSRDPRYASMLRTTCVATRLFGGHAYNALPQTATANVNCRILPTSSAEEVMSTLAHVLADTAIAITYTTAERNEFPKSTLPIDPTVLSAVSDLTKKTWGDIPVIPTMSTGATDSKFLRAVGIPSYGISGIFSSPGETNAHGRDEKLRVKSFYEGLDFLDQLVRRVAGGTVQP